MYIKAGINIFHVQNVITDLDESKIIFEVLSDIIDKNIEIALDKDPFYIQLCVEAIYKLMNVYPHIILPIEQLKYVLKNAKAIAENDDLTEKTIKELLSKNTTDK